MGEPMTIKSKYLAAINIVKNPQAELTTVLSAINFIAAYNTIQRLYICAPKSMDPKKIFGHWNIARAYLVKYCNTDESKKMLIQLDKYFSNYKPETCQAYSEKFNILAGKILKFV